MQYTIEDVELVEQESAVVLGQVAEQEIGEFLGGVFGEVVGVLQAQGLAIVGEPFALYEQPSAEGFRIVAGFPCSAPVAPSGRVVPHRLPGGRCLRVLHRGAYGDVAAAYQAVEAHMAVQGLVPAGPPRESYLDGPEVAEPRTLVTWPVRPA